MGVKKIQDSIHIYEEGGTIKSKGGVGLHGQASNIFSFCVELIKSFCHFKRGIVISKRASQPNAVWPLGDSRACNLAFILECLRTALLILSTWLVSGQHIMPTMFIFMIISERFPIVKFITRKPGKKHDHAEELRLLNVFTLFIMSCFQTSAPQTVNCISPVMNESE